MAAHPDGRVAECDGRHVPGHLVVGEVHDAAGHARPGVHGEADTQPGPVGLSRRNPRGAETGGIAQAEVDRRGRRPLQQPAAIFRRLPQAFDKIHRDGIIVIVAELQDRFCRVPPGAAEHLFHHIAHLARRPGHDPRLGHAGRQRLESVAVGCGQAVAGHDHKGEISLALRFQSRQADGFKQPQPLFHAGGLIEILHPLFHRAMFDLKTADGRVGKAAKADDLHEGRPGC